MTEDPKTKITEHFVWGEARCKCGCVLPKRLQANVRKTAIMAEMIRAALGNRPVGIVSWYRCKTYNARVGGVPNSEHLRANAIDFTIRELSPMQVQSKCRELQAQGVVGGLGMYPGFTHCDRGEARWWNERNRLMSARVPPDRPISIPA